ncbi:thioredoxin family protein [Chitinophaga caseinilytica]|uniref:Thioredoxin fold domain-containing protein n=1 Tax=Chitinophaga caseinilytica TaxID=2267521 RepID=A0ABZ2ZDR0_9BACT
MKRLFNRPLRLKWVALQMAIALLAAVSTHAQGINFRNELTYEEVQALAKREHKGIFIDFYTTWCGPCKHMTRYIFTMEKVGAYMNEHYISVKIQVDSTAADNAFVRRWRESARMLATRYKVKSYPTMVYLEANGTPVNRIVGAFGSDDFLQSARQGRTRDSGYYALKTRFTSGERSPEQLRAFALSGKSVGDPAADTAADIYLRTVKDTFSPEYLALLQEFTHKTTDPGFKLLMEEPSKVNAVLGQGVAQQLAFGIILNTVRFSKDKGPSLKEKYPEKADQIIQYAKLIEARDSFDSTSLFAAAKSYLSRYEKEISFEDLSGISFAATSMYTDASRLEQVLAWLEPTRQDTSSNMYPYARAMLLYELHRKEEALQQMDVAISRAEAFPERMFRAVREEMVKGGSLKDFSFILE